MAMLYNPAIMDAAARHLDLVEWPGSRHNPQVLALYAAVGHGWVRDDETPWCAAFVGAVLAECGLPHTGRLNARSYLDWGQQVTTADAMPGDVVVFWRGSPEAATGHVAFLVRFEDDRVLVRGGNQGNKVSDAWYPLNRLLGIRRADGSRLVNNRPTLQPGARGAFVTDLQDQLVALGYFSGRVDGHYGPRTREAVLAFQADNGLATDGVIGPRTWQALETASPRPNRAVTEEDLRSEGSRTIVNADRARATVNATLGGGGALVLLDKADEAIAAVDRASGTLDAVQGLVLTYWPLLALAVAGVLIWRFLGQIKQARVEDAQTGRHMGR
jgi:uncharacterized protein (TIGR02594 family)